MLTQKKIDDRVLLALALESLLAFGIVVIGSLAVRFAYPQEKSTAVVMNDPSSPVQSERVSPPQPPAETSDGLRYNPARTTAYVKSAYATVTASTKADAAVLDHIPYGSLVDLGGWDSGRKFVKIKAAPSTIGYVSISELTYEDPAIKGFRSDEEKVGIQTWKMRLRAELSINGATSLDQTLDVDSSGKSLMSRHSLSEFFNILSKTPSKSNFDFNQSEINYAFLARDLDGRENLIYPRMSRFIFRIKKEIPRPGVLFDGGAKGLNQNILESDPSQPLKLRLTKEPLGLLARPLQELSNVGLSVLNVFCMELRCALRLDSLPSPGSTGLSALIMGQVDRVKPTMVLQDRESGDVLVGFLDIDGDRQYDAAVYVGQRFADILTPATVYVAENHLGSWRLKYIKDDAIGRDAPRVSVEPGVHPMPINVRLFNDGGFGISYTLDGSEPSCPGPDQKIPVVREAEVFIDRTISVKAKACGSRLKDSAVVTFNYEINK